MSPKRMTSARIDPRLADIVDRLAAREGITRSAFWARAVARDALRASGASQPVDRPGDEASPAA